MPFWRQFRQPGLFLGVAFALLGCIPSFPPMGSQSTPGPNTGLTSVVLESPQSRALQQKYASLQATLLARGLLRTDVTAEDTYFSAEMAVNAFRRIAFFEEYSRAQGGVTRGEAPINLARWEKPIRYTIRYAGAVPAQKVATDNAKTVSFLNRLSALTGLAVIRDDATPNFVIQFASLDKRQTLGPDIARAMPSLTSQQIRAVTDMDKNTFCLVWTEIDQRLGHYQRAYVFIPAEHPDLLRLSCLHEEISQAMGLPNDSPTARPSIFNDDEEFAVLTPMDEVMLKMLYAPALEPGMTETQAGPILLPLARRLLGGNS